MNIPFLSKFKTGFPKEHVSVGVDIGSSAIKIVKLKFSGESIELATARLEPAGDNIETNLKKIVEFENIDKANVSVSGFNVVIRNIEFPRMKRDELSQALKFEVEKHIPFAINEVEIDAHILRDDLPDNKMKVLVAAAKKDFIKQRVRLMQSAGLRLGIIDIDSLALINAFNNANVHSAEQKAVVLLNIGASETNLNILENGILFLSRDIHIAGNNFTKKIAEVLGLDSKAAEELKLNPAGDKKERIAQAVESVLVSLAAEIRVSFDYYESQSVSSVAKIFLSGGGSLFAGLKDSLVNMLDIEVDYWDPLKSIIMPPTMDQAYLKAISSQLAVAVGLALRK